MGEGVRLQRGHGQMKPEQQEIERLRREVAKLDDLAGGMAMRCAGSVAVGLPCLAEPLS